MNEALLGVFILGCVPLHLLSSVLGRAMALRVRAGGTAVEQPNDSYASSNGQPSSIPPLPMSSSKQSIIPPLPSSSSRGHLIPPLPRRPSGLLPSLLQRPSLTSMSSLLSKQSTLNSSSSKQSQGASISTRWLWRLSGISGSIPVLAGLLIRLLGPSMLWQAPTSALFIPLLGSTSLLTLTVALSSLAVLYTSLRISGSS